MKTIFNKNLKNLCILTAAVFLLCLLVLSCGSDNTLKFRNDGKTGNLIDETNGRYYIYCLGYLRAAAINPNIYAICPREKGVSAEDLKLYEVSGIDPALWLSEDIAGVGVPFLFREQSVEEPTLAGFETKIIHITITEELTVPISFVDDPGDIEQIVNDFLYNEQVPHPDFVTDSLTFNFESEKYAGIYYILECLLDDKNNIYLYDRWTGRCVLGSFKMFAPGDDD